MPETLRRDPSKLAGSVLDCRSARDARDVEAVLRNVGTASRLGRSARDARDVEAAVRPEVIEHPLLGRSARDARDVEAVLLIFVGCIFLWAAAPAMPETLRRPPY